MSDKLILTMLSKEAVFDVRLKTPGQPEESWPSVQIPTKTAATYPQLLILAKRRLTDSLSAMLAAQGGGDIEQRDIYFESSKVKEIRCGRDLNKVLTSPQTSKETVQLTMVMINPN
jgi:hypothetical protein